jgi:hypothetical protein
MTDEMFDLAKEIDRIFWLFIGMALSFLLVFWK